MKPVMSAVICSLLLLSGCAARVSSDVTTFHQQPIPAGETIRIVAANPDDNSSLEFRSYANRIATELREIGYTPVTEPDVVTDLIAEVEYSVEVGPTEVYSDPSSSYVRYHFGFGRFYNPWYFGFYDPFYDPLFDAPRVYSTETYQRSLKLNIMRADGDHERLFEGRVESIGTENSLPEVMPYLITAMFENFPGENGATKVVTIEKDL